MILLAPLRAKDNANSKTRTKYKRKAANTHLQHPHLLTHMTPTANLRPKKSASRSRTTVNPRARPCAHTSRKKTRKLLQR
jgi:hypothetical protein